MHRLWLVCGCFILAVSVLGDAGTSGRGAEPRMGGQGPLSGELLFFVLAPTYAGSLGRGVSWYVMDRSGRGRRPLGIVSDALVMSANAQGNAIFYAHAGGLYVRHFAPDSTVRVDLRGGQFDSGAWLPDGKRILMLLIPPARSGRTVGILPEELAIADARRGTVHGLVALDEEINAWAPTPDGRRVVLAMSDTLQMRDLEGGRLRSPRVLTAKLPGHRCDWLQWSPDGSLLAYKIVSSHVVVRRAGAQIGVAVSSLWVRETNTGRTWELVAPTPGLGTPKWHPSGRMLAYAVRDGESDRSKLYFATLDGGAWRTRERREVTGDMVLAGWSYDAKAFAYSLHRQTYVSGPDAAGAHSITPQRAGDMYPRWVP